MCDHADEHRTALEKKVDRLLRENDLLLKRLERHEKQEVER